MLVSGSAVSRVFTWNAENKLVMAAPAQSPPPFGAQRVKFVYDYMGRRIEKFVETWTDDDPDEWVQTSRTRYVYDGWLLLEELEADTEGDIVGVLRQYTWGLDLAGLTGSINDRTSAGGIGGLLAMYDTMGTTSGETPTADDESYYYCYDANGNVGQVLDASDGSIAVKYEYDAYGNRVNTPGGGELDQPFRFSTKYFDPETKYHYYGYRYLGNGRWLNRDRKEESGGINLYAFSTNEPIATHDALGLQSRPFTPGAFDITLSNQNDYPNGPGTGALIRFTPTAAQSKCCKRICFIQMAETEVKDSRWYVANDIRAPHLDGTAKGRRRAPGHAEWPCYNIQKSVAKNAIELDDVPGINTDPKYLSRFSQSFETCAVCTSGSCEGVILGCRKWGHYLDSAKQLQRWGQGHEASPEAATTTFIGVLAENGLSFKNGECGCGE